MISRKSQMTSQMTRTAQRTGSASTRLASVRPGMLYSPYQQPSQKRATRVEAQRLASSDILEVHSYSNGTRKVIRRRIREMSRITRYL